MEKKESFAIFSSDVDEKGAENFVLQYISKGTKNILKNKLEWNIETKSMEKENDMKNIIGGKTYDHLIWKCPDPKDPLFKNLLMNSRHYGIVLFVLLKPYHLRDIKPDHRDCFDNIVFIKDLFWMNHIKTIYDKWGFHRAEQMSNEKKYKILIEEREKELLMSSNAKDIETIKLKYELKIKRLWFQDLEILFNKGCVRNRNLEIKEIN